MAFTSDDIKLYERLAALETKVDNVRGDVAEIKTFVREEIRDFISWRKEQAEQKSPVKLYAAMVAGTSTVVSGLISLFGRIL